MIDADETTVRIGAIQQDRGVAGADVICLDDDTLQTKDLRHSTDLVGGWMSLHWLNQAYSDVKAFGWYRSICMERTWHH